MILPLLLLSIFVPSVTSIYADRVLFKFSLECKLKNEWNYKMDLFEVNIGWNAFAIGINGTFTTSKNSYKIEGLIDGNNSRKYQFLLKIVHTCVSPFPSPYKTINILFPKVAAYQKWYQFLFGFDISDEQGTLTDKDIPVKVINELWFK